LIGTVATGALACKLAEKRASDQAPQGIVATDTVTKVPVAGEADEESATPPKAATPESESSIV
jgi:hypothetical protein